MFENEIVDAATVGFAVGFAADVSAAGLAVDPAGHTFVLAPVPFVAASHVGDRPAGPDSAAGGGAGALAAVDLFFFSWCWYRFCWSCWFCCSGCCWFSTCCNVWWCRFSIS